MSSEYILAVRHLKDTEDLRAPNRDTPILPGQENEAVEIGASILEHVDVDRPSGIFFITSGRRRTIESSRLIGASIKRQNSATHVRYLDSANLREMDQGCMKLPDTYAPPDFVPELAKAGKILNDRTFPTDREGDPTYRFGDPELDKDGVARFPEIEDFFREPGESFLDLSLRLYEAVLTFGSRLQKSQISDNLVFCLLTHQYPLAIFQSLSTVVADVLENDSKIVPGSLMRTTWDIHNERKRRTSDFGAVHKIDISGITDHTMLAMIRCEVDFLKQKYRSDDAHYSEDII